MATTAVSVAGRPGPAGHKRVTLKVGTDVLTLPVTSEIVPNSDVSPSWTEIGRSDLEPLLRRIGKRLEKIQLNVLFTLPGGMTSVQDGIITLRQFADHDDPVLLAYSPLESGYWRITDMPYRSTRKHPVTNETVRAEITLLLTREPNPPATIVARPTPATVPTRSTPTSQPARPRTSKSTRYTVKGGDTLSAIAARLLGNANRWPEIATANHIKDPRRLRIGQVLTIPGR